MAFPATELGLTVEVALGADLGAVPSTWSWTDATDYVRVEVGVNIRRGGFDGGIQAPPSTCTLTLDNTDGRWVPTNPTGAWYGQLSKGTPIRVVVDEGTPSVRWTGFLTSLPPRWDPSENDSYVLVTASGILQRLGRGSTPLRSPLVRAISGTSTPPVTYWPGEDGSQATSLAEYFGGEPMQLRGRVVTLASDAPAGSDPVPEFTTVSGVLGEVANHLSTGEWTVACLLNFPASPTAETVVYQWYTTGSYPLWRITLAPAATDTIALQAFDSAGTMQINETDDFTASWREDFPEAYGEWLLIMASASQNGTGVEYGFTRAAADGSEIISGTEAGITAGAVNRLYHPSNAKADGMLAGHFAAWNVDLGPTYVDHIDNNVIDGRAGDSAAIRAVLLGDEEGVTVDANLASGAEIYMGPQSRGTFLTLLRECETASNGRLTEKRDPTADDNYLELLLNIDLENQAVALTLDHDSGHLAPQFEPVDDDQQLRNDWTATRSSASGTGSSARLVADSGNLTPAHVGTYDDRVTVNVETDEQLIHQAGWRLNIGTHEGLRFPVVTLDFKRNPSRIGDWITCDIGSRVSITNPPTGIAPDAIDLLLEGWAEQLGPYTWTAQLNCAPYGPWHVFRVADTSADANVFLGRLAGEEKAALRIATTSTDTSASFDPNFHRWTTVADDFDPDLRVRLGGEVVEVSAISTSAATFVAAGAASHADNAAITPAIYAGASIRRPIFVLAAIRSSGTGTLLTPTGYTRMPVFPEDANVQLFCRMHTGTEVDPTVTPSGGSAGDSVSAITFGFGNMPGSSLDDLGDIVIDSVSQLNASAQDIAYGGLYSWRQEGCVQLILGWKQDDWTSVAPPAGFTEITEADTALGSDQGIYAAYRIDTTPAVVNGGSLVVTGGGVAISRSAVVAIAGGFQTMTISARSINGVVKAHSAATKIEVEDPGVLAL